MNKKNFISLTDKLARVIAVSELAYYMGETTPLRSTDETLEIAQNKINSLWQVTNYNSLDRVKYRRLALASLKHLGYETYE